MSENTVDIEKIMDEIHEEIAEKHLVDDLPKFSPGLMYEAKMTGSFSREDFTRDVTCMSDSTRVLAFRDLPDHGIKLFFKRFFRKMLKFYVEPIAEDQTRFNTYTADAVSQLWYFAAEQSKMNARIQELETEVQRLTKLCEEGKKQ